MVCCLPLLLACALYLAGCAATDKVLALLPQPYQAPDSVETNYFLIDEKDEIIGRLATISAIQPAHYQYGTMEADERGLITKYEQYPFLPYWINGGFMVFEREALRYMQGGEDVALETGALQDMIADEEVMIYHHHGFWRSMDTLKDAIDLQQLWDQGAPWRVWD